MIDNLLRIEDLTKKYQQSNVFHDVSFSLKQGENLVIQGTSGCGKTTLLRCIALLEEIDQGRIIFEGKIISSPGKLPSSINRKQIEIGMVFQQLYLWSHMTVLENVSLPLWLQNGKNKSLANEAARKQLAELGIEEKAYNYPNQLSGGQKQRVALARALVHSPKLLLLDEITANLDPDTAQKVLEAVERIAISGTSVILVTHSANISDFWRRVLRFDGSWTIKQF